MTLEEARDACLYHEARLLQSAGHPEVANKKTPAQAPNYDGGQNRRRPTETEGEIAGNTVAATRGAEAGRASAKPRCDYCSTMKLRGAEKHDDASCWKNPANAHLVPEWYRQRRAIKVTGQGEKPLKEQAAGGPRASPTEAAFMVTAANSTTCGTNLRVIEASVEGSPGTARRLELLIDTGSDVTLLSSRLAEALGVEVYPLVGSRALRSAGSCGTINVLGHASVRLTVEDVHGVRHAFSLSVEVAEGLNEGLSYNTILLGMKTMRKMGGRLDM
ncbi:hypothetical protein Pmar_PMAR019304, partial [Perkinsus marinus ATCC 50983]